MPTVPVVDEVFTVSFDAAKTRYPEILKFALERGPPEPVFRAHWAVGSEYHGSLRSVIMKSAAAVAAAAPQRAPQLPQTVDEVMSCRSFDEAKTRYPKVLDLALQGRKAGLSGGGPSEAIFRSNWGAHAEYHKSLKDYLAKAVAAALRLEREEKAALDGVPKSADDVLGCRGFDDAKARYAKVIQLALKGGPAEAVFRSQWAPGSEYHSSLRDFLTKAILLLRGDAGGEGAEASRVTMRRDTDGDFWGFLVNKKMKVIMVNAGSPAEKVGLKVGKYVLAAETEHGVVEVTKPADAYGPQTAMREGQLGGTLELTLTVSDDPGAAPPAAEKPPEPAPKKEKEGEDSMYSDVGFSIAGERKRSRSRSPDEQQLPGMSSASTRVPRQTEADRVALKYLARQREEKFAYQHGHYTTQDAQTRAAARVAPLGRALAREPRTGDTVFRRDGQTIRDRGAPPWSLRGGDSAEVVAVRRAVDKGSGHLRLKLANGAESDWLAADGWRFSTVGRDWGVDCGTLAASATTAHRDGSTGEDPMRYKGVVDRVHANGFGFAECKEVTAAYSRDAYIPSGDMERLGLRIGSRLEFKVQKGVDGKISAKDVRAVAATPYRID